MAEEAKPTSGPWIALPLQLRDHGGRNPIFANGIWWILPEADQERCPIAIVDTGDDHDEQTRINSEADARLIAAAPELLEALNAAMPAVETLWTRAHMDEDAEFRAKLTAIIAKMDAAISRATGSPK